MLPECLYVPEVGASIQGREDGLDRGRARFLVAAEQQGDVFADAWPVGVPYPAQVRRGPDPDLIIRHLDGYHGAIAASWTTYASAPDALPAAKPPLLDLEGLGQLARVVEQLQERSQASGENRL